MSQRCFPKRRLGWRGMYVCGFAAAFMLGLPLSLDAKPKTRQAEAAETPTDQWVKQIESRLGREEDGHFVIVFKKTSFVYVQKRGRTEPFSHYFVDTLEGREAAARAIVEYMLKFRGLGPKPGERFGGGTTPPPVGDWKALGRYKTAEEAEQAAEQARATFKARGGLLKQRPEVK